MLDSGKRKNQKQFSDRENYTLRHQNPPSGFMLKW